MACRGSVVYDDKGPDVKRAYGGSTAGNPLEPDETDMAHTVVRAAVTRARSTPAPWARCGRT